MTVKPSNLARFYWFAGAAQATASPARPAARSLRDLSWRENLFIAAVTLAVTFAVGYFAWLSEDCFITLRYVSNTLGGFGPVFNVGERVQGYTHPLWFVLLVMGSLIVPNPMLVAYAFSFGFTLFTVATVGRAILRAATRFVTGATLVCLAALAWVSSDSWLSFQTSGLENSLANLLIAAMVYEVWIGAASRPGRLMLWMGLLCLTRPDFVVWVAPLAMGLLANCRSAWQWARLGAALLPVVAWLAFSLGYYHDIFPNTFYAKVGNYPSMADAVAVGLAYLQDWFHYDALAAGATIVFLGLAAWSARTWPRIALLAGIALYVVWVVQVGGDFMRGRLFTPVLTAAVFTGCLAVAQQLAKASLKPVHILAGVGILILLALAWIVVPAPMANPADSGVVNERKYYPGYALAYFLEHGRLQNPDVNLALADTLRNYTKKCGPITIHMLTPGTFGYLAGPDVTIIDTLGLTDAFIARLPRQNLVLKIPRPGHPKKFVPISYLVSRKDVALLPNWLEHVARGDCGLSSQLDDLKRWGDQLVYPK